MALSQRQLAFIDYYLKTGNASASAVSAGYSSKGANVTGSQLLTKPNIAQELAKRQAEIAQANKITVEEIVRDLKTIRDASITKHAKTGLIQDSKHALKALELLGKTIGAFTDRVETTVTSIRVVRQDEEGTESEITVHGVDNA